MKLEQPLDLVKLSLDMPIYVKLKGGRELSGKLHAFDAHMNLVLEGVEETKHVHGPEDGEDNPQAVTLNVSHPKRREFPMLFVRGDSIILVAPV